MKKIIDGKTYNTETATLLGEYYSGNGMNDCNYVSEDLYVTKKGTYFLDGQGGAMSKYSHLVGNMSCAGKNIIILSESEAREWSETHLTPDEYFEIWGEPEEG